MDKTLLSCTSYKVSGAASGIQVLSSAVSKSADTASGIYDYAESLSEDILSSYAISSFSFSELLYRFSTSSNLDSYLPDMVNLYSGIYKI